MSLYGSQMMRMNGMRKRHVKVKGRSAKGFVWAVIVILIMLSHIAVAGQLGQYEFERFRLANGLQCLILQMPHATTVSTSVAVKIGAEHELGAIAPGVRFMLAQAIVGGTRLHSAEEFAYLLTQSGAELNCSVEPDCIIFHVESLPEHCDTALHLLADLLIRPAIDSKSVEAARERTLLAQFRSATTPYLLAKQSLRGMLFRGTPYSRPICGYERTVRRMKREHLLEFYDAYFRSWNMAVCVAGDIEMSSVKRQLTATFNSLPKGSAPFVELPEIKPPNEPQHLVHQFYGDMAQLVIGFVAPPIGDPDSSGMFLLSTIIGRGSGSRLHRLLREERRLAYYARSSYEPNVRFGELILHVAIERDRIEECRRMLEELLLDLRNGELAQWELEWAKRQSDLELELMMQDAEWLSTTIARLQVNGIDLTTLLKLRTSIHEMTHAELVNIARRYLKCAAMVILLPM